jgi:hypothetical protein
VFLFNQWISVVYATSINKKIVRVNMLINIAKIKVLKQMLYTLEMIRQETSPSMEDEDGTCSG